MKLDLSTGPHLFFASSAKHRPLAHNIAQRIASQGKPATAEEPPDLYRPGEDWQAGLKEKVERSQAAVVIVSPDSYESSEVREEWSQIQERIWADPDFKVIPVVVEDAQLPPFLKKWRGVSASQTDSVETIAKAVEEVVTADENRVPLSQVEQDEIKDRYRSIARRVQQEIAEFQTKKGKS